MMSGQDNCGLDTSQAGAQVEPVSNRSGGRPYPCSMGLRSKACPPSRRGISLVSQIERPCPGLVERCSWLFFFCVILLRRMSGWNLLTILRKLGCFTYLGDLQQPTYYRRYILAENSHV